MKAVMVEAPVVGRERYGIFCRLVLHCPEIARRAKPGQFVNAYAENPAVLLPRPFSIMRVRGENIEILFNVVGLGTSYLGELPEGASVRLLGPLGKWFTRDTGHGTRDTETAVLVGGGVGVAPFPFLAEELVKEGRKVVALVGAKAEPDLPLPAVLASKPLLPDVRFAIKDFEAIGINSAVALDAPTPGFFPGTVVDLLCAWLNAHTPTRPHAICVFACGPTPMLKALQQVVLERNLPAQFSMEEHMACGIGICLGCPIKVRVKSQESRVESHESRITNHEFIYRLCCTHGPIFDAAQVVFE